jgi:hypothetical protein
MFECAADEAPVIDRFDRLDEREYGAAKVLFLRAK